MVNLKQDRPLRIVLNTGMGSVYQQFLEQLGHNVVGSYYSLPEFIGAISTFSERPDVILTNATETADLHLIYTTCCTHSLQVPCIIFSPNLGKLSHCEDLKFVYGVCPDLHNEDIEAFRAVLLLAIVRFEQEETWRFEKSAMAEKLQQEKLISRACAILYDSNKAATMTQAYKLLQKIATSYSRPLHVQAERIVRAADEMQPKKKQPKPKKK